MGYFQTIMIPFVQYQFWQSTKICSYYEQIQYISPPSILDVISNEFLEQLCDRSEYRCIFRFLYRMVLVTIDSIHSNQPINILNKLLLYTKNKDQCIENLLEIMNEIIENIPNEIDCRLIIFIQAIVNQHIVQNCLKRVLNMKKDKCILQKKIYQLTQEQIIVEINLKILIKIINIYTKLKQKWSQFNQKIIDSLGLQIQYIFQRLPQTLKIIYIPLKCTVPFSSGQNIEPITLVKHSLWLLLSCCLNLSQKFPAFIFQVSKVQLLEQTQHYLNQNRWNNIVHHTLQKICISLISTEKKKKISLVSSQEMKQSNDSKKSQKIMNLNKQKLYHSSLTDKFLEFLIQSFNNKQHVFLNSLRFTSQGNLHSLYNIAKCIVKQLQNSHQLVQLITIYNYWKKFVINDLHNYQNKTYYSNTIQIDQNLLSLPYEEDNNQIKLEVDQVVTIKEIVYKIKNVQLWPINFNSKKKYKSMIHNCNENNNYMYHSYQQNRNSYDSFLKSTEEKIFNSRNQKYMSSSCDRIQQSLLEDSIEYAKLEVKNKKNSSNISEDYYQNQRKNT